MAQARPGVDDPAARFSSGHLPGTLLIGGANGFLIERAIAAIRRRLDVEREGGGARTVWGDDPPERVLEAVGDLANPGLFGGTALVVVRRFEAVTGPLEARVLEAIEDARPGHLVLVAGGIDRRRKIVQRLSREAIVDYGPVRDRHQLAAWVGILARESGVRVSSDGADALVERCGGDLARLASELEKLSYREERVGIEDVRQAVAATRDHGIDELASALQAGDRSAAVRALRALLSEGEAPLRIVAFLAANLRRALHVAELARSGLGEAAIASRLGIPGWLVRKQRMNVTPEWAERALETLCALDRALKQSRAPDAVIERAVLSLTTPSSAERRPG